MNATDTGAVNGVNHELLRATAGGTNPSGEGGMSNLPEVTSVAQTPEGEYEADAQSISRVNTGDLEGEEKGEELSQPGYKVFEDDAWNHMITPLPGSDRPIYFTGIKLPRRIRKIIGRPLQLPEVKWLVQPDGVMRKCNLTKGPDSKPLEFQPVKFVCAVPDDLRDQIFKQGKHLLEIDWVFAGCFFLDWKTLELQALSGNLLRHTGRWYELDEKSPLGITSIMFRANNMPQIYGDCWSTALDIQREAKRIRAIKVNVRERLIPHHSQRRSNYR